MLSKVRVLTGVNINFLLERLAAATPRLRRSTSLISTNHALRLSPDVASKLQAMQSSIRAVLIPSNSVESSDDHLAIWVAIGESSSLIKIPVSKKDSSELTSFWNSTPVNQINIAYNRICKASVSTRSSIIDSEASALRTKLDLITEPDSRDDLFRYAGFLLSEFAEQSSNNNLWAFIDNYRTSVEKEYNDASIDLLKDNGYSLNTPYILDISNQAIKPTGIDTLLPGYLTNMPRVKLFGMDSPEQLKITRIWRGRQLVFIKAKDNLILGNFNSLDVTKALIKNTDFIRSLSGPLRQ